MTNPQPDERLIRVVAVDDDPMVLDLIRVMLKPAADIEFVGSASDGDEAIEAVIKHRPDVMLMDLQMKRLGGIEATRRVMARPQPPKVVILTTIDEAGSVPQAMEAGAIGFLLKASAREELYASIRAAANGDSPMSARSAAHLRAGFLASGSSTRQDARARLAQLSPREQEVAALVAQELTNDEIAKQLHISGSTVKQTVSSAQNKLGVAGRVGIARIFSLAQ